MDQKLTKAEQAIYKLSEISKLVFELNKLGRETQLQRRSCGSFRETEHLSDARDKKGENSDRD